MNKHTPGPWLVKAKMVDGTPLAVWIENADDVKVADLWERGPDVMPDAHLISAAPELLAELEKCEFVWDEDRGWHCPRCSIRKEYEHLHDCKLNAALKKARGE